VCSECSRKLSEWQSLRSMSFPRKQHGLYVWSSRNIWVKACRFHGKDMVYMEIYLSMRCEWEACHFHGKDMVYMYIIYLWQGRTGELWSEWTVSETMSFPRKQHGQYGNKVEVVRCLFHGNVSLKVSVKRIMKYTAANYNVISAETSYLIW
jgi:hypothetical protein